jgi:hypothetical protein
MAASFSYGEKDYYLGGSPPLWQLFRVAYRGTKQPIDGLALLLGYCWAAIRRVVSPWRAIEKTERHFESSFKFKKVDSFHLLTELREAQDK